MTMNIQYSLKRSDGFSSFNYGCIVFNEIEQINAMHSVLKATNRREVKIK